MDKLRFLIETREDLQKDLFRLQNRIRSLPKDTQKDMFLQNLVAMVQDLLERVEKEIKSEVQKDHLYMDYLRYQKGIAHIMGGYLVAWLAHDREFNIRGITNKVGSRKYELKRKDRKEVLELPAYAKVLEEHLDEAKKYVKIWMPAVMYIAENPSDLHKYSGIISGSKLRRGESHIGFNPRVKTLMWKVYGQLLKARGRWSEISKSNYADYDKRCPPVEKGSRKAKVRLTTKNITMRQFTTNMWVTYRQQNGLSVTEPYPSKLGHDIIRPFIEKSENELR